MGAVVRAASLQGYVELVRGLGADPEHYMSRFGIPIDTEHHPDAFIPVADYACLLEVTAEELHRRDLGLRLTRLRGFDVIGPIAVIVRNSETVLEALKAVARFMYVHTPVLKVVIEERGDYVRVVLDVTEHFVPYPVQAYEANIGVAVRYMYLLAGPDAPMSISLLHSQHSPDAAYRQAFGCRVRFEQQWYGFEFPASVGARRIRDADPETKRIVIEYLEATYLPQTAPLSERVAEHARKMLPIGICSVHAIADHLGMHPRTLQRRLAAEGLRCQDVIDLERQAQAVRYLSVAGLHLNQIAALLGYSEQSAFNRSFRRWFGTTPREFRERAHL
ncbi:AraC family transcriptional regulator [Mycolicibacterium celeriflavum]|nr:AraC family transcriptional regulator [Mycolicibacterium celeriflavum]MCV7236770.1 AraC family transcriptional regulator [Mycolicibacterium celeriflavum]ORA49578.1 AraC family transcriptional regulator [Mycolicibacterium celeriflavum]